MFITQQQYNINKQSIRDLKCKIDLLDFNFNTVNEISGNVIDCSVNIDANSDIRRTCDITLIVNNSSFDIRSGSQIWMDKYIDLYIGVVDIRTREIVWNKQGIFLVNNASREYNATTNTLKFQGVDLAAKLTGLRNGNLESIPTIIPYGSNIRNVMISLLEMSGFKNYIIDNVTQTVPYEIKVDVGGTVWDVISELRDILPNYETFFDINGVFHYQKIPSEVYSPVILDNELLDRNVTGVSLSVNFEEVKNKIEVFGKAHNPDYFGGTATVSSGVYNVTIASFTKRTGNLIGFVAPSIVTAPKLKINSLSAFDIVNEDGTPAVITEANEYYVVRVLENGKFLFMGRQQPRAIVVDDNVRSPFYINGTVGTIYNLFQGGEFDLITTDDLCRQRAEYELWKATNMNNGLTLTTVPFYWIDVNQKISYMNVSEGIYEQAYEFRGDIDYSIGEYVIFNNAIYVSKDNPPLGVTPVNTNYWMYVQENINDGKCPQQFIIKTVSHGCKNTEEQSIYCIKFYPFYPYIVDEGQPVMVE